MIEPPNVLLLASTRRREMPIIRCAENIARWWMFKHNERPQGEGKVSFPGEVLMPQGLVPIALWLAAREYAGIWRHGGGDSTCRELEIFGVLYSRAANHKAIGTSP
jgi:hypothetical protein